MDSSAGLTPLLIDAKREYVGQLTDVLAPYVINYVQQIYLHAVQQHRGQATLAFQRKLREIPQWGANMIQHHTGEVQNRYAFLGDLIAACFVAYVKILSSIKLHQQKPNIRLRLPANDVFVHKVYINAAREFYANPALVKADRAAKAAIVRGAVEASVRDMLPIEDILKAYLGNTVDAADHTMNPGEMADEEFFSHEQQQQPPQLQQHQLQQHQLGDEFDMGGGGPGEMMMMPQQQQQQMQMVQPVQMVQPAAAAAPAVMMMQPAAAAAPAPVMMMQPQVQPTVQLMPQPQQQQPQQQQVGGPPLFVDEDSAPKQISIGATQQQQQQLLGGQQQQEQQQDLFSDAEDEF